MLKKTIAFILAILMLCFLCSCKAKKHTTSTQEANSGVVIHEKSNLLGFVVYNNDVLDTYVAMKSFIDTSADIGMNAKLYRFSSDSEISGCVNNAINDNCDAVIIYAPGFTMSAHIDKINSNGIQTISLATQYENASCNIITDDCTSDITVFLREKQSGTVLIYSSDSITVDDSTVKFYKRTEYAYKDAADSLELYLKSNTGIKSIYAIGSANARPAVIAAKAVGDITVIGSDITDVNTELFDDGLYALAVCPWHEIASNSVYVAKSLCSGEECADIYITTHIVTEEKLEKYTALQESAAQWFNVAG